MTIKTAISGMGARLWLLIAVALLGTIALATAALYTQRTSMLQEKYLATKHVVEIAHGVVTSYHQKFASGQLTEAAAKSQAAEALKSLRYEGQEYFWINDMQPKMVMHPLKPELDTKDLSESKDPSGKKLFVEFVNEVKRNQAGYVSYLWPKPGSSEPVPKVSYVKGFTPWGWVIGSGIYLDDVDAAFWSQAKRMALTVAVLTLLLCLAGWLIVRSIVRPLRKAVSVADAIAQNRFDNAIDTGDSSEIGTLLKALARMQTQLRERNDRDGAAIATNMRIKQALDTCTTNVMIADPDGFIVYMNESVRAMLTKQEAAIRQTLPTFDVKTLLGTNFDGFHKNPAHQRNLLGQLKATHRAEIGLSGQTFSLIANPIFNETGERVGAVVEWKDRTAEVAVEREVGDIVTAAAAGDFARRIALDGKEGFFKLLAERINQLLQTSSVGLADVSRMLESLAQGNLTNRISADYSGTFGKLKDDSNATATNLAEIINKIKEASQTINVGSQEIAAGNLNLSQRTEEQASSLQETASSMEELTQTVKQNAENSKQANQLAIGASQVAVKGGEMVAQVVGTMASINESSKKIVDIISVIDGIAFQTNILALNAAVEAARAGEQGRGFAVVASEVRNLAQRSASAAKEIKSLIGDSVDKVETGTKLVEAAGATMGEIVTSVKRVSDIIAEITAASQEQSSGIEQVGQAITQMDQVTQQNAALVEQAAAAAESMRDQAAAMAQTVSVFVVDTAPASSTTQTGPKPASTNASTEAPPALPRPSQRPRKSPETARTSRASITASGASEDEWTEF